jgi:protoporphyrinogen oxidase
MERLTILGGGPAGLAVAFYAQRAGVDFQLYEQSPHLGGLCRTLHYQKHSYDTGAHRFHNQDPEVTSDLKNLLGERLFKVSKPSKVFMGGRFVDFPPTPIGMLRSAGLRQMGKIGFDIVRARRHQKEIVSFADFAIQRFGETLARRFLLNYTEKVWGLPPEKLSPAVATKRLSGMSLRSLVVEVVHPANRTNHIDGHFLYPLGGYGTIPEAIVEVLPHECLRVEHKVTGLGASEDAIDSIGINGIPFTPKGRVVSTLPLTLVTSLLGGALPEEVHEASAHLRFRNIRLIFVRLSRDSFTENASIYVPDRDLCISRLYEPRNRCRTMAPPGETGIVAEIPCFAGDSIDQLSNRALYQRAIAELEKLGLLERTCVLDWQHHYLSNAYPVYSLDYAERVKLIIDALAKYKNLDLVGRNGLFFYSHLHDQMRFGKDYVAKLKTRQQIESRESIPM